MAITSAQYETDNFRIVILTIAILLTLNLFFDHPSSVFVDYLLTAFVCFTVTN